MSQISFKQFFLENDLWQNVSSCDPLSVKDSLKTIGNKQDKYL